VFFFSARQSFYRRQADFTSPVQLLRNSIQAPLFASPRRFLCGFATLRVDFGIGHSIAAE